MRAFDPVGEIAARDTRGTRDARGRVIDGGGARDTASSRAAARAALADSFAERFGIDDSGPSAAALADRFGFRYEATDAGTGSGAAVPAGRRTVTISGRGGERAVPLAERTVVRGGHAGHRDRAGGPRRGGTSRSVVPAVRVDRVALIAVGLGLLLAFLAATSAHAATLVAVPR